MAYTAATFGLSPEAVMDWRVGRFTLWFHLAIEQDANRRVSLANAIAVATWDPKRLPDLLSNSHEDPPRRADLTDKQRDIAKAAEIDRKFARSARRFGVREVSLDALVGGRVQVERLDKS